MNMIKLTGLPHPDIADGVSQPVYVSVDQIMTITIARTSQYRESSAEESRLASGRLAEEILRVSGEISRTKITLEDPQLVEKRAMMVEATNRLTSIYNLIQHINTGPQYYPRITCTEICLACGTALEHGVMLARHYVMETPEQVFAKIFPFS